MYPNINKKKPFDFTSNAIGRGRYSNMGIYDSNLRERTNLSGNQGTETIKGYHFEMKMMGYIKEDFNYYIINNDLVVTTEKDRTTNKITETKGSKHSYCYPSALFKKTFHLPDDVEKDNIIVDYKNHILSIDLLKSNTISNS